MSSTKLIARNHKRRRHEYLNSDVRLLKCDPDGVLEKEISVGSGGFYDGEGGWKDEGDVGEIGGGGLLR